MTPKAVLFDCDGVLVDSEPATRRLLIDRLANAGLVLSDRQLSELFLGGTIASLADRARAMGADLPDSWVPDSYEALFVALADTVEIPGATALLDALDAARIPYAVCSNGPMRKMEITLGATGLWDRLEGRILSAHVHGAAKPAPDLYLIGAQLCGAAPEDCIVVEDSPNGARAAKAAGMPCLALALPDDVDGVLAEGSDVISTLSDVRDRVLGPA